MKGPVVTFLILVVLCGCAENSTPVEAQSSPTPQVTSRAQEPAAQAYLEFHKKLAQAKSLTEIQLYLAASPRAELESHLHDSSLLADLQQVQVKDAVVDSVEASGRRATLRLRSSIEGVQGTAVMVLEGQEWRLLEEDWEISQR